MIGKIISHYKIIEKLGEGGMGEVYLAEDTELDRKIAIKFLSPHYTSDEKIKARFKREAKAAASLNHPNIITIYEVGEFEGKTYIAMEFVDGESLKELIDKNELSTNEVIDIVLQICEGLKIAHKAEVVHRDLKPGNILINKDGRVKIIDFGLAKLKGATKLTKDSVTIGTLHYMSPEQAQGADVDPRTDIWSLGVILYEMITGNLPFQGVYEAAVLYSILNEEPELLTEHKVDVSEELQQIISNILKKNPDERYQNVRDLTTDLQSYQQAITPDSLRPKSVAKKIKKKKKLSWLKKVLLGFGVFLLLILCVIAWYIYPFLYVPEPIKQQHDKAIAVLYFDNMSAEEDAYFTDGLTEELISRLTRVKNLKVASRTDVRIYKSKPTTIADIGKDLNVDYVIEGSVRKAENRIRISAQLINVSDGFHRWAETYDRVISDIFVVQDDVAINIAQRLDMEISNSDRSAIALKPTENIEAYDLVLKANSQMVSNLVGYITPDSTFEKTYSMFERALELDPNYGDAWSSLGASYLIHFSLKYSAIDDLKKNRLLKKASLAAEHALNVDPQNEIGLTISPIILMIKATGRLRGRDEFKPLAYRRAKIQMNKLVKFYPESPLSNLGLAFYHIYASKLPIFRRDRSQIILKHLNKAFNASERILKAKPNDPIARFVALSSTDLLVNSFNYKGEYDKSISYYNRLIEILSELNDSHLSTYLIQMAILYNIKGDHLKALDYIKRALEIHQDEFDKGVALHFLGETKFLIGIYTEASKSFESASEVWAEIDNQKQNMWTKSWWALSELRLGNLGKVHTMIKQIETMMKNIDPYYSDIIIINWNLSQVYDGLGQKEKSQEYLKVAYNTVISRAENFKDIKAREKYLTDVRENREVVAAWEKLNQ